MKLQIVKGKTSKSIDVFIRDTSQTDGRGLAGLAYNTSNLVAYYHRPGSAATAITLATLGSATAAWSSGGFIAVDGTNTPGLYRFDLPNAVLASGVDEVVVMLRGAANMSVDPIEIQLTTTDPNDAVRGGLTALPNVATGNAGAVLTAGTGTAQLNVSGGRADSDILRINGNAASAANLQKSTSGILPFTVTNAAFSPTNTEFEASDVTIAQAVLLVGRRIIGLTGNRTYEAAQITGYTLITGRGHFTVTSMSGAFANGDTGIIV